jgi:hypothetical protein
MRKYLVLIAVMLFSGLALAQNWSVFKSDKFGFAMLVAPGTEWAAKDFGKGWGGIAAKKGVVEFAGIAKLKTFAPAPELEKDVILITGIPAGNWKKVDEGTNKAGWKWWRSYEARGNGKVLLTVIGNGPRGSYILFLGTTEADLAKNRPLYKQWYNTLTVY